MPESIEDEPEFCGWLRRNDPDITNRAEAARIVDLIEELMDEDVTGHELVTVYPHANLLISPRKWNPALNMLLWAVLGGAFGWSIVAVMGWVFWHLPELWRGAMNDWRLEWRNWIDWHPPAVPVLIFRDGWIRPRVCLPSEVHSGVGLVWKLSGIGRERIAVSGDI